MANQDLIKQARQIASLGDRWFLLVAHGLERLGDWAQGEADVAADSARAALATTVDITKRLASRDRTSGPGRTSTRTGGSEHTDSATSASRRTYARSPDPKIDLLEATPARASHGRRGRSSVVSVGPNGDPSSPPGLVPLLRALGRVVASHDREGYATLESDERFWTLVYVLQSLRKSPPADPGTSSR
jgi:hypothetical protein